MRRLFKLARQFARLLVGQDPAQFLVRFRNVVAH